jgi:hypothetical protein
MQLVTVHVGLALEKLDAEAQLGGDVDFLVARHCEVVSVGGNRWIAENTRVRGSGLNANESCAPT